MPELFPNLTEPLGAGPQVPRSIEAALNSYANIIFVVIILMTSVIVAWALFDLVYRVQLIRATVIVAPDSEAILEEGDTAASDLGDLETVTELSSGADNITSVTHVSSVSTLSTSPEPT